MTEPTEKPAAKAGDELEESTGIESKRPKAEGVTEIPKDVVDEIADSQFGIFPAGRIIPSFDSNNKKKYLIVRDVVEGQFIANMGLQTDDKIMSVNGLAPADFDLKVISDLLKEGEVVVFEVKRGYGEDNLKMSFQISEG